MRISTLLLSLLLAYSCGDSKTDGDIDYNEAFRIEATKLYAFPDGGTIEVISIDNSYCPCSVTCFWISEVVLVVDHSDAQGNAARISIHEVQEDLNLSGYSIVSVKTDEACVPKIEAVEIIVVNKAVKTCGSLVLVDNGLYDNGPKDEVTIIHAALLGDCLTVKYRASGCDGNSWKVALYDSNTVSLSCPSQRYIRLSLQNKETCTTSITKETSFNLTPLQMQHGGIVILKLDDYVEALPYPH